MSGGRARGGVRVRARPGGRRASRAGRPSARGPLTNAELAELLAREAEEAPRGHVQRAFRRASRLAFLWPEEAAALHARGEPLTAFPGIGPFLARRLREWIETPLPPPSPPDLRRGFLPLTTARAVLAAHPTWPAALRGDLQMHTTWSDGSAGIREMAAAARARGYEYVAITDHSQGLRIAGGIGPEDLAAQGREIAEVNAELEADVAGLNVLRSIELNLNPAGEGDMPADSLGGLDLVLGSFHSALRRTEDQTERYLAALRNPHVHVLGHPRGRIYNFRRGLSAGWARVFAQAAELDKAVEIDAFPDRQDLDVDLLELARESGVRISLGTDAHHPWQLAFIELGLAAAIRAGIARDRVLNFLPRAELLGWVAELRDRAGRS